MWWYRPDIRRQQIFPSSRRTQYACAPYSSTPLMAAITRHTYCNRCCCPFHYKYRGGHQKGISISELNRTARRKLAVYASQGVSLPSHATLASWLLARLYQAVSRWVRHRGFCLCSLHSLPPLPNLLGAHLFEILRLRMPPPQDTPLACETAAPRRLAVSPSG